VEGDFFSLGYFPRGKLAEKNLLSQKYNFNLDPINYPTLDMWDDQLMLGVGIKSLDLRAASSQDLLLARKLDRYVQRLRTFNGDVANMRDPLGNAVRIDSTSISSRELALIVGGKVPDSAQLRALESAARAAGRGRNPVTVSIYAGR